MLRNHQLAWARAYRSLRKFLSSEVGTQAIVWFAGLFGLLLLANGLNVVNSYVGRDFMTAVAAKKTHEYATDAVLYFGVFLGLTAVTVVSRFSEERLRLLSRSWMTRELVNGYLSGLAYYRIKAENKLDNPDQRITEDVKAFTQTALAFLLLTLNASITSVAFLGVLWSISPWLVLTAVVYATVGSGVTLLLGRRLVELDNLQLKKEADFRYRLIQVREDAETIGTSRVEPVVRGGLLRYLQALVENNKLIIKVTRNLGFFINAYNYLIQLVPLLIVAPLYMRGHVEFGVVTQSAMAFAQVLGAFSLIVTQFETLSSFAAVSERLNAVESAIDAAKNEQSGIEIVEDGDRLQLDALTLFNPRDHGVLIRELSLKLTPSQSLLITGSNAAGAEALFLAVAGVWPEGKGQIIRPKTDAIQFVPRRPYIAPGTLREELLLTLVDRSITDDRLLAVLKDLGLDHLAETAGGLNSEQDWPAILGHGDQQLLAFARLLVARPCLAFIDRGTSDLTIETIEHIYQLLKKSSIGYISIGEGHDLRPFHHTILELHEDGTSQMSNGSRAPVKV